MTDLISKSKLIKNMEYLVKECLFDSEELLKDIENYPTENLWRRGKPTEEDIRDIDEYNEYCFAICMPYNTWLLSSYLFKANMEEGCFETETSDNEILKVPFEKYPWYKIEPFKEKS